jgi:protein TonB
VGKEVYRHDARGNVVEMTVRDDAGSVVSQEVYAYEFDALGNWTKMTTSVAVVENSNVTYEPTEVTYRTIAYYRTDAVAKATLAPAALAEEPGLAASSQNPQKNEAAETDAPKQIAGPAADSESQAATGRQAASSQPAIVPAVEEAPRPPDVPAEKSGTAGGAVAAAKTVGDGGSADSERPSAVPPSAGESEAGPTSKDSSGGVLNSRAIELPRPVYSESARRWGHEGTVKVNVNIDVTGRVFSARAVSGPHQLRGAAEEAARRARFSPTLRSGQPMGISGVINYVFSLKQ